MVISEEGNLGLPTEISKRGNEKINSLGVCYSSETPKSVIYGMAADLADMVASVTQDSPPVDILEIATRGIEIIRAYGEDPEKILAAQEAQNRGRYWWVGQHHKDVKSHPFGRMVLSKYAKDSIPLSNITARMYLDPGMHHIEIQTIWEFLDMKKEWHKQFGYTFRREEIIELMRLELVELFESIHENKDVVDRCLEVADIIHLSASLLLVPEVSKDDGRAYQLTPKALKKLMSIYQEDKVSYEKFSNNEPQRGSNFPTSTSFASRGITELHPSLEYRQIFDQGASGRIERELVVLHHGVFVIERDYSSSGQLVSLSDINVADGKTGTYYLDNAGYVYGNISSYVETKEEILDYLGSFAANLYSNAPAGILLR